MKKVKSLKLVKKKKKNKGSHLKKKNEKSCFKKGCSWKSSFIEQALCVENFTTNVSHIK